MAGGRGGGGRGRKVRGSERWRKREEGERNQVEEKEGRRVEKGEQRERKREEGEREEG